MPKIAIALFHDSGLARLAMQDLTQGGLQAINLRMIAEPRLMEDVTVGSLENVGKDSGAGATTTARAEFESQLARELRGYGAAEGEVESYVRGVRKGGALLFATGSEAEVDQAAGLMNSRGAIEVEELQTSGASRAAAPTVSAGAGAGMSPVRDESVQTGRGRSSGGGARVFVW